jgi:predicted phosphate transport protein (TIGR00153 family)
LLKTSPEDLMSFLDRLLRPRQDKFLALLLEQAQSTLAGLELLEEFMRSDSNKNAKAVSKAEKTADEVRRVLIDELNRTFITPIDREDIYALSRAIDDVMDYAYTTVDEMDILQVEPNQYLQKMASLLREAGSELLMAVQQLKDHPSVANDHAKAAKTLENQVESVYREAIADLFKGPASNKHLMKLLKLREVYRHLSNAADRGDEAANIIGDITVKMT